MALLRKAALAGLTVSMGKVRIVDASLVDPGAVAQDDAALVAVDGLERATPPFERRGARDAAVRGSALQGHAEPHEADEVDPGGRLGTFFVD